MPRRIRGSRRCPAASAALPGRPPADMPSLLARGEGGRHCRRNRPWARRGPPATGPASDGGGRGADRFCGPATIASGRSAGPLRRRLCAGQPRVSVRVSGRGSSSRGAAVTDTRGGQPRASARAPMSKGIMIISIGQGPHVERNRDYQYRPGPPCRKESWLSVSARAPMSKGIMIISMGQGPHVERNHDYQYRPGPPCRKES
jgi:hypothetical protein